MEGERISYVALYEELKLRQNGGLLVQYNIFRKENVPCEYELMGNPRKVQKVRIKGELITGLEFSGIRVCRELDALQIPGILRANVESARQWAIAEAERDPSGGGIVKDAGGSIDAQVRANRAERDTVAARLRRAGTQQRHNAQSSSRADFIAPTLIADSHDSLNNGLTRAESQIGELNRNVAASAKQRQEFEVRMEQRLDAQDVRQDATTRRIAQLEAQLAELSAAANAAFNESISRTVTAEERVAMLEREIALLRAGQFAGGSCASAVARAW